jgi:hypothetical protein
LSVKGQGGELVGLKKITHKITYNTFIVLMFLSRFLPAPSLNHKPRMDFISDNLGGYCYTWWTYAGDGRAMAEVHLTPASACTVTRTVIHEVSLFFLIPLVIG